MDREPDDRRDAVMELDPETWETEFSGEIWTWRGPAPHHFMTVPAEASAQLRALSSVVTYGWGMIPVRAWTGASAWETSLFAKDGLYVLPLKAAVRREEGLGPGDTIRVRMTIRT